MSRRANSAACVEDMLVNLLAKAIDMFPRNVPIGAGKIRGDLEEIEKLYNYEEYFNELKADLEATDRGVCGVFEHFEENP